MEERLTHEQVLLISDYFNLAAETRELLDSYAIFHDKGNGHYPPQEQVKEDDSDPLLADLRELSSEMMVKRTECLHAEIPEYRLNDILSFFRLKRG